jgi:uncharacterized protein (TIGR02145 family)
MQYKKVKLSAVLVLSFVLTTIHAQTVKDIDENIYKTLTLGTQTWMAENLKTTKYRNGDVIKTTTSSKDIRDEVAPQYQWASEGKESNVTTYGRLYTWYTVADNRGICPIGWHVPTDADWSALTTFLGGEVVAYSKLKESGEIHWNKYDTGTNETGFTALPGGLRSSRGPFIDIGESCYWWSSNESGPADAWCRQMNYNMYSVYRFLYLKRNGLSVRCIKN